MPDRPKKRCAFGPNIPDPLVDPGNPPHRHQAGAKTHSPGPRYRLVTLATRSSGRLTKRTYQTEIATVMLVSIREHLEPDESFVILYRRSDSQEAADVDEREPRPLRP